MAGAGTGALRPPLPPRPPPLHRVNEARLRLVREQERFIAAEQARREGELRQRLAAQKKRQVVETPPLTGP